MKPTPTHSNFLFWLHAVILCLNSYTMVINFAAHKPFAAICNMVVVAFFLVLGMSNFQKFLHYRKEMKAYNIEQKELELKQLKAAFAAEFKAQKLKVLQEKFSNF